VIIKTTVSTTNQMEEIKNPLKQPKINLIRHGLQLKIKYVVQVPRSTSHYMYEIWLPKTMAVICLNSSPAEPIGSPEHKLPQNQ